MKIKKSEFVKSITSSIHEPHPILPTFILMGRSNVGKSSLINMLLERKKIAKTSSTPGKTKMLNYFLIDQAWYLVDVPGYGWARISQLERKKWEKSLKSYLKKSKGLFTTFLLIDARHPPQKKDVDFIMELQNMEIPFSLIFTKIDLVKKKEFEKNIEALKKILERIFEVFPKFFFSSSKAKKGKKEILTYIGSLLEELET